MCESKKEIERLERWNRWMGNAVLFITGALFVMMIDVLWRM